MKRRRLKWKSLSRYYTRIGGQQIKPLLNIELFEIKEHSKCTKIIFESIRSEYSTVNFNRKKNVIVLKRLLKVVSKAILFMLLASVPDLCILFTSS